MNQIVATGIASIVGACIGSFLNVCIARWPANLSVVTPRSRCPTCERPIQALENIPILGWLMLGGRCAGCKERISIQYPLVELLIAVVWGVAVWYYGATFAALRVAVFTTVMIGIAITDAKHYLIPDGFTLFGLLWVLGTAFVGLAIPDATPFEGVYAAFVGACAGAGAIAIAGWLGELALGKEAMGFGDVTLMAVVGAAVGPNRALLTIFIAAALGVATFLLVIYPIVKLRAVQQRGDGELPLVPFGVFLAPAAVVALLWGSQMIDWYTGTLLGI